VIVHPEVPWDVVQAADDSGSTEYIIKTVSNSPEGSIWAVGTRSSPFVNRSSLSSLRPAETFVSLRPVRLYSARRCSVLSPNHLLWILEELVDGRVHNRIVVPEEQKHWNRVALERMLSIS
jgi:quinolinate synthase